MATPIVVVGSLNVDLVVTCEALPAPGQTVPGTGFHRFAGGKGANQAVAAARLGAQVRHIGCVGDDDNGRWLIEQLRDSDVDADLVAVTAGAPTGTAVITVGQGGQNTIVVVPGANHTCTPSLVEKALARVNGGILLLQLEIPMDSVVAAARQARRLGMKTLLNPAPAQFLPDELVSCCDFLIPNETEATALTSLRVATVEQALRAATVLSERGPEVIVTLGESGAVYASPKSGARHHQAAWPVHAADATAAGDAFVGAFAVSLAGGALVPDAMNYAAAAGALTATRLGAQVSLPTAEQLSKFVREAKSDAGVNP